MKTKTRKTTRILCASTIAAMTILGSVAPALTTVMAEDSTSIPTVTTTTSQATKETKLSVKGNSIGFDKKIYLDDGENTPHVTINYHLESRIVDPATQEYTTLNNVGEVKPGPSLGDDPIANTTFTDNSVKNDDGSYVFESATIDASSLVDVEKPTVYTYNLTEDAGKYSDIMTARDGAKRKLNIYVGYTDEKNGTFGVIGATLADADNNKKVGFENDYNTNSDEGENKIKVTKKVTGNQGDKTKEFNFKVTINGQYSTVSAEAPEGVDVNLGTPDDGKKEMSTEVTFAIKSGQSVVLKGITKGATYSVEETDAGKNGYTTETTKNKDTKSENGYELTEITNNRNGTIPTGIYLNHKLPFNVLGVALAGGVVALIAKKRHEALEDEDDE